MPDEHQTLRQFAALDAGTSVQVFWMFIETSP